MIHKLNLINESTVATDDQLAEIAAALEKQINRDFREVWWTNAEVNAVPTGGTPEPGAWWLTIADTLEVAEALGYHDLTPDMQPVALIGAKLDIEYHSSLSVTIGHEALEMLGDPLIGLMMEDSRTKREYAYENCDAVEADTLGYEVDGVLLSDFVYPAFFNQYQEGKAAKLDHGGHVKEPFEILEGGYLSYRTIGGDGEWRQITKDGEIGENDPGATAPADEPREHGKRAPGFPPGSRRERRLRRARGELVVSSVTPHAER